MPIKPIGPGGGLQPVEPLQDERPADQHPQGSQRYARRPAEIAGPPADHVSLSGTARVLGQAAADAELQLSPAELRRLVAPEHPVTPGAARSDTTPNGEDRDVA